MLFSKKFILVLITNIFIIHIVFAQTQVSEPSPMKSIIALVAGSGLAGDRVGNFLQASFNHPLSMAFSGSADALYVADKNNNKIKKVDFSDRNHVSTLIGNGKDENTDGNLLEAGLKSPSHIVNLGDNKLAIVVERNNESGPKSEAIRIADLNTNKISTPKFDFHANARNFNVIFDGISDITFVPGKNKLIWCSDEHGYLATLDLKSNQVSLILKQDSRLRNPRTLTVFDNILYVGSIKEGKIFKLPFDQSNNDVFDILPVEYSGSPMIIRAGKNDIFVLETGHNSLYKLFSKKKLNLITNWGDLIPRDTSRDLPLFFAELPNPCGMSINPVYQKDIYISCATNQQIIKVSDYMVEEYLPPLSGNDDRLIDYEYEEVRKNNIQRLLAVSDSRFNQQGLQLSTGASFNKQRGVIKQLEAYLNIKASINGLNVGYELLQSNDVSWNPLFIWPYYKIPKLVKKYNVDTVLFMVFETPQVRTLLSRPFPDLADSEQDGSIDGEFAILPDKDKLWYKPFKDFYETALKENLVREQENGKFLFNDVTEILKNENIKESYSTLIGDLISKIRDKTQIVAGHKISFNVIYIPLRADQYNQKSSVILKDACEKNKISFSNFHPKMAAVLPSFYGAIGDGHLTIEGHQLFAQLLSELMWQTDILRKS